MTDQYLDGGVLALINSHKLYFPVFDKIKMSLQRLYYLAGHRSRARPGPIPNPEVKPAIAAVLLTCVSGRETAVLAFQSKVFATF